MLAYTPLSKIEHKIKVNVSSVDVKASSFNKQPRSNLTAVLIKLERVAYFLYLHFNIVDMES